MSRISFILLGTMLCAASAVAQQPASDSKPAESRVITGRVVSDSGQPLAGAGVFGGIAGSTFGGQRTSTDSEGNFKLQGLDAGLYRLTANLPGYVFQSSPTDLNLTGVIYRPGESATLTLTKGGVIAGTVATISGEPVVNVTVRAFRVRDVEGNSVLSATNSQPRLTDDRGYYRIYGLLPGTYIVAAGGQGQYFGVANPFANDAPTYAPASTRDTAAQVVVRSDQEVTADIRYRGEPGHIISGKITGTLPVGPSPSGGAGVRLSDLDSHAMIANASASGDDHAFQINAVSDGEYEIMAFGSAGGPNTEVNASPLRRITVKGADVTGLVLTLAPMASIGGRVSFETDQKLNCGRRRDNALRETLIVAGRERVEEKSGTPKPEEIYSSMFPRSVNSIPNEKGEINFRNLAPGNYRFEIRTPGAGWYVKDLSAGPSAQRGTANRPVSNLAKTGIALKPGDKLSGVTITIAEGGAGFRGRITIDEGQNLPSGERLYLVPAERDNADNVLRFFEGTVASDGTFAVGNIAPGRYWVMAQPAEATDGNTIKSIKSDDALRAKISRAAEGLKREITFKPCERVVDYQLPYNPGSPKE